MEDWDGVLVNIINTAIYAIYIFQELGGQWQDIIFNIEILQHNITVMTIEAQIRSQDFVADKLQTRMLMVSS